MITTFVCITFHFPLYRRSVLDDISQDDATCRTLATAALDTPTISTNPIVLEWLQGPRIRELLVSTAEYVAIFATDVEKVAASWKLIHAALRARTCSNLGECSPYCFPVFTIFTSFNFV